jgi:hypothetical protein
LGRWAKFGLIGCGGLLALVVVIVVVVAAVGGGGDETANQPSDAEQGEGAEKAAPEPKDEPIVVRVTGDPGIAFSGNIATSEGSRTVDGTTPQDFPVEVKRGALDFDTVTATAQNTGGGEATLTVQILQGEEVVKEATTTADYGAVTTTWTPGEQ